MTASYDSIIYAAVNPTTGTPVTAAVSTDRVLDEAEALLREGGHGALSMRRLAERLGCSYQVVYSRVGGMPDVLAALHGRGFADLETSARTRIDGAGSPRDAIEEVAAGYVRFALRDPVRFDLMFGVHGDGTERPAAIRAVEQESFGRCWVEPVRAWWAEVADERPRGAATALAWRLWAAVHGIAVVHLAGHASPGPGPQDEARRMVRLLLDATRGGTDEGETDPRTP